MPSSKVRVVVRVRPAQLLEQTERLWVHCINDSTLHTLNHRNDGQTLAYEFQTVFSPECSQRAVYTSCVQGLLPHLLKGQNASVFAYGPTGAGKTHTILGTASDPGIIPRAVREIIDMKNAHSSGVGTIDLSISYLEIYQEKVVDLLCPGSNDLPIREGYDHNIFIAGLTEKHITSVEEFNSFFAPASKNRFTAATKLNNHSSRSHSVLIVKVTTNTLLGKSLVGKLHIIDLAGSEDNRRTGNQGERLRESGAINASLLALSQVVDALNKNQPRVPYRGSKLTRLLQDSLGGNSHSCMIVNLAPEERYYYDTYVTLNFARKTKKIINKVKTNVLKDGNEDIVKVPSKRPASEPSIESSKKCTPEKIINKVKTNVVKNGDEDKVKVPSKRPVSEPSNETAKECTPEKKMTPAPDVVPFLSPFIRNQATFTQEMVNRLENFESRIMEQIRMQSPAEQETTQSGESLPPKHLSNKELRDDSKLTNKLIDLTNSPLFDTPKVRVKRHKFRSSAAPVNKPKQPQVEQLELQKNHNERILSILNSGNISEIKTLQTIGGKKAAVIAQWTKLNGPLQSLEDLREAVFSAATFNTFLKKNLVQLI